MNLHPRHALSSSKRGVMEVLEDCCRGADEHQAVQQLAGGFEVLIAAGF